jgi:hypothetical protein
MGKLQKIQTAIAKAQDNDATRAIKYLLWMLESQRAEMEFLKRAAQTATNSPEHNAAAQIDYQRRLVDEDKSSVKEHDDLVARFRKNV